MAEYVIEFSPPVKIKSNQNNKMDVEDYYLVLAPFQKKIQVEFVDIKVKETAVRFLTVVNPLDKPRQLVLPPPSNGICFDVYEFMLQPNTQCKLSITWQPLVHENIRKLIKIEEVGSNKKYDFVILGNCIDPSKKNLKGAFVTYSKSKNSNLIKKHLTCGKKKIMFNKTKVICSKAERIRLVENFEKLSDPNCLKTMQSPIRRQTYLVEEKENFPDLKENMVDFDNFINPKHSFRSSDKKCQDYVFNNHMNIENQNFSTNFSSMCDDEPLKLMATNNSPFKEFCLTPLKNTKNLISPFSSTKKSKNLNLNNENLNFTSFDTSPFKPIDASTAAKSNTPEEKKPSRVSVNLSYKFEKFSKNELNKANLTFIENITDEMSFISPKIEQSSHLKEKECLSPVHTTYEIKENIMSSVKSKKQPFVVKNSPCYRYSPKASKISKNRLKQNSIFSPRVKRLKTPKLDKCDQYLKCLTNPELVYHSNSEDPFLKMSQYYEAEWLVRQESDMIRWLNALLMPNDKLADEEQSNNLEQAAVAWVQASKMNNKNKPMIFATQKDLFVAQLYRQSPQQWSALRKAASNLITSTSMATVLSKLTVSIEKDLITVRNDRQIHLDLNLKQKITDLLKCYNPLWLRIGLETIYGQIINVKSGSDLDGLGWFVRKNLFNNDFIKQKFTNTNILQVNLPSYNIAMKKFILRKLLMLIYFLDHAKEQQLITHNPCLFKIDSFYKSSYDFLMGFCANMITANGDINRRLQNINYNLTHKQTHLDEVNYAVKSLNDLRDGTRLTKIVEILFKGDPLSQKLRLPAISKLQKVYNVNLAFTRISEHINIEGNITTRDIVNGHREKLLSLFWQIIYKYLTPRYNSAAIKIQHWWRNNSLNLVILKRIRAKQNLKQHLAATKIQAYVRGYLTRKKWPHKQTELIENRKKLHLASTKIKHYLQNKLLLLTEERKQFIILKRTVVFVQRKFRSKMAMKIDQQKYVKVKQSALLIQKVYRGFIIRKNWPYIKNYLLANKERRVIAINIVKRTLRKNLPPTKDELYYKNFKLMILNIQRRFRANILMKTQKEEFLLLKKSAIFVQQRFKAKKSMISQKNNYLRLKECTIKLQAITRGYIVRKQWPVLYKELQSNKNHLIISSNIIKRVLRKNLPPTEDRIEFLKLKKCVIVLQRRFRSIQNMKLQREWYLKLKTVTIKLQSMIRGYILRKQWPTLRSKLQMNRSYLINCSNTIKKCLRKNLPVTKDRLEFIRLKTATVVLQRRFRAIKMMKNDKSKYIQIKVKIVKLQCLVKGYIARKQWPMLRRELQANKIHKMNCSNIIKRVLRRNLPLTEDRIKFLNLKKSTIIVQRRFRAMQKMKQQRKKYLQLKIVTLKLQSVSRGNYVRKRWLSLKNELIVNRQALINCSNVIKRLLRKNLPITNDRLKFIELKRAVIIIQNRFRANRQAKEYQLFRHHVIVVQRRFRANIGMKHQKQIYEKSKIMIIRLQSYFRGHLERKKWPKTKLMLETKKTQLILASNIIKRFLRQCLPPASERLMYLQLKQSVINIQTRYRAIVAMKLAVKEYILLKYSVTVLQRFYRAHKAMIVQKCRYNNLKKSTIMLQAHIRGYLARKRWIHLKNILKTRQKHAIKVFQKENVAALKIQTAVRGFLVRKKLPQLKCELLLHKQVRAATLIQAFWRAYCVRKKYQCKRQTLRLPKKGALTLGKRHNDVIEVLTKQNINEYSYRELATVFWNLDTCTSLSKELCVKTAEGMIVDYMFYFLQYSNQSQPSIEAREPVIRVLTNLLKYHETSWYIWLRTIKADMVKNLIKMMKTCCGKIGSNKLYCSISTWLWIALQDPEKKHYIREIPSAIIDLKFMMDTLNKKYKKIKMIKKTIVFPSTRPAWSIGSKCQKCFDSDLYATAQICKLLSI